MNGGSPPKFDGTRRSNGENATRKPPARASEGEREDCCPVVREYVPLYVRAKGRLQNEADLLGFSRVFRIRKRPGIARPASSCLPRGFQGLSGTLVELRRFELLTF